MEKELIGITSDLIFQLINTTLVFLLLKKLLFKPVLDIVDAREQEIQDNLAKGEVAKNQGIALKSEYEEKVSRAKEEGQEIIKQATLRAEQKSTEIIDNAKYDATQIKEKAERDIEQERQKAMNEIKDDISDIALLAASKVIEKDIDKNKHEDLINDFIKKVGESK
ncbi:MAG: F0F1 ATP synthase subunit B [Peptostreptococcaceae bacterium]